MSELDESLRPVVPFLRNPPGELPYLEALECAACGAVFLDARTACASCFARDRLETRRLSNQGKLYVYSIVYRSFPGIEVPYVSAVVDLEGGGTLKGTLRDVQPDPAAIQPGMAVGVVFEKAAATDAEGNGYLGYHFRPLPP